LHVSQSAKGYDVVDELEGIRVNDHIVPERIKKKLAPSSSTRTLEKWAYDNNVGFDFSRPGEPTNNTYVESFNVSFRDECLNISWFLSLEDAKIKIRAWCDEFNSLSPYSSLDVLATSEVVKCFTKTPNFTL
jgi:putative transposase